MPPATHVGPTCLPSTGPTFERDQLAALQAENARLIALLEDHGIEWRLPHEPAPPALEPEPSRLSTAEKVALFRRLFRGRIDVYPIRWEGKTTGKSGYAPAEPLALAQTLSTLGLRHYALQVFRGTDCADDIRCVFGPAEINEILQLTQRLAA